jgi:formamidopyrimidine-DNA glycosylase
MPELPEVETVRRGLEPVMAGATIVSATQARPDLRFAFPDHFVARLEGAQVIALRRRAKYLLADLSTGETLLLHLGMSGSFRTIPPDDQTNGHTPGTFHHARSSAEKHDHFSMQMSNGHRIVYNDPRRFGFMLLHATDTLDEAPHLRQLGVEPLGNDLHADFLNGAFRDKRTPLKAALLDQRIIAGLGNIYVCEALYRAGLSPRRMAGSITTARGCPGARIEALVRSIRAVLDDALNAGGSTLRDFSHADGALGYFQHSFSVYDREAEPCPSPGCSNVIQRIVQSGRSTFFCARCQR